MTADLYVREGSRFIRFADTLYRDVPPIPTPVPVDVDPPPVDDRASFVAVDAPRCPHGSFVRWAACNCRRCAGLR